MEKEINLVEILKDCPQGIKLYSTIFGCVDFEYIENEEITVTNNTSGDTETFNKNGSWYYGYTNECMLFPAKDQRDWSKFKAKQIELELIDGEIYYVKIDLAEYIYIYKKTYTYKTSHYVSVLNNYLMVFNDICTNRDENIKVLRKATEEEKRLFFETIEKNGRKWDADKKELVRIEPKFDISTLQHFDKILVRDCNEQKWKCDFYDSYANELDSPFRTTYSWYKQCIPYNNETKHLASTTEMPPEKYINW